MFQKIADYTELLLPDYLLREGNILEQMISLIPESDWTDQVQIIGWLYQFYNTEPKEQAFNGLKNNTKIDKKNIPAATQLFTPDWIVHYMVENSIGRLWLENHGDTQIKEHLQYFSLDLTESEIEENDRIILSSPEEIKCIDPCSGSGHVLCVMFDTLVHIYEDMGYPARDAAVKIVQENIFGLDIDDRAAQLSYFTVMMKARQYDRRFFSRGIQPNVYSILETNEMSECKNYIETITSLSNEIKSDLLYLIEEFKDAKEYGSLICLKKKDYKKLLQEWSNYINKHESGAANLWSVVYDKEIERIIKQALLLSQEYNVVITNPPYMGGRNINPKLLDRIVKEFPEGKADMFSAFILRTLPMVKVNGYQAMVTMHSWMFLSSFEALREKLLRYSIVGMIHLGARAFEEISGEVVQTTAWVLKKTSSIDEKGQYIRLLEYSSQDEKEKAYLKRQAPLYIVEKQAFDGIPGKAFGYWLENKEVFKQGELLEQLANPRQGLKTLDNDYFIRYWYEVDNSQIMFSAKNAEEAKASERKWFPLNHGGEYRKYYGNNLNVVNWESDGKEMKALAVKKYKSITRTITNIPYYFKEGITWSVLCSEPSFRWYNSGFIFSNGGQCIVPDGSVNLYYLVGLLNSKISGYLLNMLSPTLGFESGYLKKLPIIVSQDYEKEVTELAQKNIAIYKEDWDDVEISWDFKKHPLVKGQGNLQERFEAWSRHCEERFYTAKKNEERLNEIFISIYGLQHSLAPEVADKDVSIRLTNQERDIKSLISYAVGCMFGRYSLDEDGLICAGNNLHCEKYKRFIPDKDAILPVTDDQYFEDDIVERFVNFISIVYGEDSLENNLKFIADSLGGKGTSRDIIRNYFRNVFYKDHVKLYQKCPIYWMFSSGKKGSFKCLTYIHRYEKDTIARIRTDYVHELQERYRNELQVAVSKENKETGNSKVKVSKRIALLNDMLDELHKYEEKVHHLSDRMISFNLDAGIKKNYAIISDVLEKM